MIVLMMASVVVKMSRFGKCRHGSMPTKSEKHMFLFKNCS